MVLLSSNVIVAYCYHFFYCYNVIMRLFYCYEVFNHLKDLFYILHLQLTKMKHQIMIALSVYLYAHYVLRILAALIFEICDKCVRRGVTVVETRDICTLKMRSYIWTKVSNMPYCSMFRCKPLKSQQSALMCTMYSADTWDGVPFSEWRRPSNATYTIITNFYTNVLHEAF